MFRQFAIRLLSSAVALLLTTLVQAGTLNVSLVLSDNTPPYRQFSAAFNKALAANNADVTVIESQADAPPTSGSTKIDLIIAVGAKATEFALTDSSTPQLSVMIPRTAYETLHETSSAKRSAKAASAIYLDQPWDRQMHFIQVALPKHSIVGMLYSPDTHIVLPRLPRGMSLNVKSVSATESLFAALENILASSDVLLVIPDSEIYSSSNVRNILLASYRQKVPLVGISQAYVNAGALCAIFSAPEQLAAQVVETIISFASGGKLPEPQYPASFSIGVNQQVARSLGIEMASPDAIRERMNKVEMGR